MKKKSEVASATREAELVIPRMTRAEMRKGILGKYATIPGGRVVGLDPDVARVFDTSESVNTVLRAIIRSLLSVKKQKKSA